MTARRRAHTLSAGRVRAVHMGQGGAWLAAGFSTRAAGWFAATLWFVPWQSSGHRRGSIAHTLPDATPVEVEVGGQALHGFEAGTGPTILLVHGWADQAASLAGLAAPLVALGHRVVAVDLPAHGSSAGSRTNGFELARCVRELATRFDAEVVVAHSLGALATSLALRDGLALRGVALLAQSVRLEHVFGTFVTRLRLPRRAVAGLRTVMEVSSAPACGITWRPTGTPRLWLSRH